MLGVAGFQFSRAHARRLWPLTRPEVGLFLPPPPPLLGRVNGSMAPGGRGVFSGVGRYPRVTLSQPSLAFPGPILAGPEERQTPGG